MIRSRSPEQCDPDPFEDEEGKRYGRADAPRRAKWAPRPWFSPTVDTQPFLSSAGERKSVRSYMESSRKEDSFWAPRDSSSGYNLILSSIRSQLPFKDHELVYGDWLKTLEEFPSEELMALNPTLDIQKIAEAKLILQRLLNSIKKESNLPHVKIL